MKIKTDKKSKKKDSKLLSLKKSSNVIVKQKKEKKSTVKAPPVLPVTFAEKKVLSVKKKNKKENLEAAVVAPVSVSASKKSTEKPKNKKKKNQAVAVTTQNEEVPKVKASEQAKKSQKKVKATPAADTENPEVPELLVTRKTIQSALKACKKALEEGFEQKKNLFGDEMKYALQVASVKIPDVPSRNCRIKLPNPLFKKGDDICLIVKDLERGSKQDYEPTHQHWQDKLQELGVDYVTMIIPFQQLKQDYRQYEMKLKLVHRFDRFLVDARISGHVFGFLGTGFIRRCKNPTPVILDKDEKIAKNLDKALCQLTYKQTNTGRTTEIQFANHKMPLEKAVENAEALIENLKSQFPGGWLNIRTIYLKPMVDIKLSLPLYVSKIDPNLVPVPKASGPRERFEKKMNDQLLKATSNKYKFQSGNLVRHNPEQRLKLQGKSKKSKSGRKTDQPKEEPITVDEQLSDGDDDDEIVMQNLEKASDTEQSDLGDESD